MLNDIVGCYVQLTRVRCSAQRIKYVVMFKGQSRRWSSMDRIGCDVQKVIGQKWRWMIKGCLIKNNCVFKSAITSTS